MKILLCRWLIQAAFAFALILGQPLAAQSQSTDNIPAIEFKNIPITMAIKSLARMDGINYSMDPKMFWNRDGTSQPEPQLTLRWENYTAADALARVLKENHLVATTNTFSGVVCITTTNFVANKVEAKLLGSDTNSASSLIFFDEVPLAEALTSLSHQAHLSVGLDPQGLDNTSATISLRWENLTAQQALVAICEVYGLVIVKGSTPESLIIKPRK